MYVNSDIIMRTKVYDYIIVSVACGESYEEPESDEDEETEDSGTREISTRHRQW